MNPKQFMVVANKKIITARTLAVRTNAKTGKVLVVFNNGKEYIYKAENVRLLKDPAYLLPKHYRISRNGQEFTNVVDIYKFTDNAESYYHICFENGTSTDYCGSNVEIVESVLANPSANSVFEYLKTIAKTVSLTGTDGTNLLEKLYQRINFFDKTFALSVFLSPTEYKVRKYEDTTPIFPFGCNSSQFKAVKNALENQISVIEGPPGTGKTQTILNIIANLIIKDKTIQVVSNNNFATANILEKMEKSNLDFIVAALGSSMNKEEFITRQSGAYPDISGWKSDEISDQLFFSKVSEQSRKLGEVFELQERAAILKQELEAIKLEYEYFKEFEKETDRDFSKIKIRFGNNSKNIMHLWQEFADKFEDKPKISFFYKLMMFFKYGITNWKFLDDDIEKLNSFMQSYYYKTAIDELQSELKNLNKQIENYSADNLSSELSELSLKYLKNHLYKRYSGNSTRKVFQTESFYRNTSEFQKEYPVVLSTTFSSRSSVSKMASFDYLIIDEASQVDVVTGALALSSAKNAVIVGDTKQLANIVPSDLKIKLDPIFNNFKISEYYNYATNSFLSSICKLVPNLSKTLLREHYRCHPKIINFCNQKFYDNQLVIMTEDKGEDDVLKVIKTAKGYHSRNRMSQRQIDVMTAEILPNIDFDDEEVGIIAPYNNQVNRMYQEVADREIAVATVHKFQGREKDTIVISTVDDEVSNFSDDPYLLNVAVSRAKKQLYLIVSGNDFDKDSNIRDLIRYIEYNNFKTINSNIYSIFDYLYSQYTQARIDYLKNKKTVSQYDSENLMYALICEILAEEPFKTLKVAIRQQLNMLIRDPALLDDKETVYMMNNWTHLDFLIYNKISKQPVLAIEVDGYHYHKEGTEQYARDKMKEHILELYKIPLIRFSTNGSGESEKLRAKLIGVMKI